MNTPLIFLTYFRLSSKSLKQILPDKIFGIKAGTDLNIQNCNEIQIKCLRMTFLHNTIHKKNYAFIYMSTVDPLFLKSVLAEHHIKLNRT